MPDDNCVEAAGRQRANRLAPVGTRARNLLLFPNPRPLEAALGAAFFQQAPEVPGIYLMRDAAGEVVYVGKAKNLRQRLASYRAANPERLHRRQLRLLSLVVHIELHICDDEASALAQEARLIRSLRPRFNRAGVWPAPPRMVGWSLTGPALELGVTAESGRMTHQHGPFGRRADKFVQALARRLWLALNPRAGLAGLPPGWLAGQLPNPVCLRPNLAFPEGVSEVDGHLQRFFSGQPADLLAWITAHSPEQARGIDLQGWAADQEVVASFSLWMNRFRTPPGSVGVAAAFI